MRVEQRSEPVGARARLTEDDDRPVREPLEGGERPTLCAGGRRQGCHGSRVVQEEAGALWEGNRAARALWSNSIGAAASRGRARRMIGTCSAARRAACSRATPEAAGRGEGATAALRALARALAVRVL